MNVLLQGVFLAIFAVYASSSLILLIPSFSKTWLELIIVLVQWAAWNASKTPMLWFLMYMAALRGVSSLMLQMAMTLAVIFTGFRL